MFAAETYSHCDPPADRQGDTDADAAENNPNANTAEDHADAYAAQVLTDANNQTTGPEADTYASGETVGKVEVRIRTQKNWEFALARSFVWLWRCSVRCLSA